MSTPKELGQIFLQHYPVNSDGVSQIAYIQDLVNINQDFQTSNGCSWARSNTSWLGKQFLINRVKKNGKTFSVQLIGFNTNEHNRTIPSEVRQYYKNQPCALLGVISSSMEIDHKDARYPNKNLSINDFQPLTKSVNDAKREHCKKCLSSKNRFDAQKLGYSISFIKGDENSGYCEGCFWYDIREFIKIASNKN